MELLVIGAQLTTCALSNKDKATVIKTRPGWCTPKLDQKYSVEKRRLQSSKQDSDGYSKNGIKVVQSTLWSNPMKCSIYSFTPSQPYMFNSGESDNQYS